MIIEKSKTEAGAVHTGLPWKELAKIYPVGVTDSPGWRFNQREPRATSTGGIAPILTRLF